MDCAELVEFKLEDEVDYIVDASGKLKCSVLTRSKALLIYHHFKRCVYEIRYDPYLVAAGCISISIKYNEEPIDYDSIILVFFSTVKQGSRQSTQDEKFKVIRKSLRLMECLILRMIEFSLNYRLAHEYLAYFMNDIREELSVFKVWDIFVETSMKITSDFYLTRKCLNYKAEEIASTVIQVALYLTGIPIHDECYLKTWIKTLNDCPEPRKQDIIEDIYRICDIGPFAESNKSKLKL